MSEKLAFVDGVVTGLGTANTNNFGITAWQYVKITRSNGTDVFIDEVKTPARMSSYVREAFEGGAQVRVFYQNFAMDGIRKGYKSGVIYSIDFETGKHYSVMDEMDAQKQKMLNPLMATIITICGGFVGIFMTLTVFGAIFGIPLLIAIWKMHKSGRAVREVAGKMPWKSDFMDFYNANRRDFSPAATHSIQQA